MDHREYGTTDEAALARLRAGVARSSRGICVNLTLAGCRAQCRVSPCEGEVCRSTDSDDLIEPTFLEKTAWFLQCSRHLHSGYLVRDVRSARSYYDDGFPRGGRT